MPFALLLIGLILVSAGARGRATALGGLLAKDFSGSNNFFFWLAAVAAVGGVGYLPKMEKISRGFLGLIIIVLVLHNKGFFAQFTAAINSVKTPAPASEAAVGAAVTDPTAGAASSGLTGPSAASIVGVSGIAGATVNGAAAGVFGSSNLPSIGQAAGWLSGATQMQWLSNQISGAVQ